jgi:hypothetical protein
MSTALTTFVPILVGTNYQAWSAKMQAYLSSMDLWLIVSTVTPRPAQAGEAQTNWDTADTRVIGIISLTLVDHVLCKIGSLVTAAQPIAAAQLSNLWWTQIENHYRTISPSQVFDLIKQAINFHLDGSNHLCPQLERLEAIHADLATNQAELPEFVWSMILLSRLPPPGRLPLSRLLCLEARSLASLGR